MSSCSRYCTICTQLQVLLSSFKLFTILYCSHLHIADQHVAKKKKLITPDNVPMASAAMKGKGIVRPTASEPVAPKQHLHGGDVQKNRFPTNKHTVIFSSVLKPQRKLTFFF